MATTVLEPEPTTTPATGFRSHHLTIDRYHRMIAAGVFPSKAPVFLWKGRLVEKMTKGRRHGRAEKKLYDTLLRLVPDGWHVLQEEPITLSDDSEPEPDVAIVRGALDDYPDQPPHARDVSLVVEVADSSLAVDAGEVLATYAREAIPIYWLVNIPQQRIEVYQRPEGARYAEQTCYGREDAVPVVLDGREVGRVAVREVLP